MHKITNGTVLVLAAVLLTGCGSDNGTPTAGKSESAKQQPDRGMKHVKRKVTLEVRGKGTSQITYNLDSNKMETVELPWKKTSTLTLTEAERHVGSLVSVVPGSVPGPDGTLHAAACVITVDGKKVADNQGGKSDEPCEYKVK